MDNEKKFINNIGKGTISEVLGIEITSIEEGVVMGKMPVDSRTHQPYGMLHGGASVVLAETLGSIGSHFLVSKQGKAAVGLEVNANHLKSIRSGWVFGEARIVKKGGRIHVWSIDLKDIEGELICTSRLTVMIITP
ncbi:MAG: PaaI family thioesterase [Flavobacteriales bacterium]|tara:strand:- start:71 stop:478 length:408 start_codon:yes stop_codon:yes gene_type:complete